MEILVADSSQTLTEVVDQVIRILTVEGEATCTSNTSRTIVASAAGRGVDLALQLMRGVDIVRLWVVHVVQLRM